VNKTRVFKPRPERQDQYHSLQDQDREVTGRPGSQSPLKHFQYILKLKI